MDSNNLNKYLTAYWTPAKCGKHTEIIKQHAMVLMPNLKVEPEDLFEQINEEKDTDNIQKTIDNINNKFGKSLVKPASLTIVGESKTKKRLQ